MRRKKKKEKQYETYQYISFLFVCVKKVRMSVEALQQLTKYMAKVTKPKITPFCKEKEKKTDLKSQINEFILF